jgi:hypothetical protein
MSEALAITLQDEYPVPPQSGKSGWWVDDNRVNVQQDKHLSTYTLPRGCRRVVVYRGPKGRSTLSAGGLKSITFTVTGPDEIIMKLREAVL